MRNPSFWRIWAIAFGIAILAVQIPSLHAQDTTTVTLAAKQGGKIRLENPKVFKTAARVAKLSVKVGKTAVTPVFVEPGVIQVPVPPSTPLGATKVKIKKLKDDSIVLKATYNILASSRALVSISTNPSSSLVAQANTGDGAQVSYSGTKDANAVPTGLQSVSVQTTSGMAVATTDSQNRVVHMSLPSGVSVSFSYGNALQLLIAVLYPNGGEYDGAATLPGSGTSGSSAVLPPRTRHTATFSRTFQASTRKTEFYPGITRAMPSSGQIIRRAAPKLVAFDASAGDVASLTLTKNAGAAPVSNALVTFTAAPTAGVGGPPLIAGGLTDANGNFTYTVPISSASPAALSPALLAGLAPQLDSLFQGIGQITDQSVIDQLINDAYNAPDVGGGVGNAAEALQQVLDDLTANLGEIDAAGISTDTSELLTGSDLLADLGGLVAGGINDGIPAGVPYSVSAVVSDVPGAATGATFSAGPAAFGNPGPATPFTVDVGALPSHLRGTLTWDTATDQDLHLTDSEGDETYYDDPNAVPNSALDQDNTKGYGPEDINVSPTVVGETYHYFAVYYGGSDPTNVTVQVYIDDVLVKTTTALLEAPGDMADAGTFMP